jgi:hypothetical protein
MHRDTNRPALPAPTTDLFQSHDGQPRADAGKPTVGGHRRGINPFAGFSGNLTGRMSATVAVPLRDSYAGHYGGV